MLRSVLVAVLAVRDSVALPTRFILPRLMSLVLCGWIVTVSGCYFVGECRRDADCDDGNFCNGQEHCQLTVIPLVGGSGVCIESYPPTPCSNPTPVCDEVSRDCLPCESDADCDDRIACTDDVCDPVTGCLAVRNDLNCPSGSFCATGSGCVVGQCQSNHDCPPLMFCVETEAGNFQCVSGAEAEAILRP